MVSMVISSVAGASTHLIASFSPAPATAMSLRSAVPVRTAAFGRLFRARTTTSRGASTSLRVATVRAASTATSGSLFGLSKGSPNSEHKRAHSILQFFYDGVKSEEKRVKRC